MPDDGFTSVEVLDRALDVLQFWRGYEGPLTTAGVYAIGVALYGILVWKLLGRLASRYLLGVPHPRKGVWRRLGANLKLALIFPLLATLYLVFLASALFILAKDQTASQILLVSVSLIGGIRIAAWLHEESARDIAKIVPLGLLGFVIVDPGIVSVERAWARFMEAPAMVPVVARYFLVLLAIETLAQAILSLLPQKRTIEIHSEPPTTLHPVKPATFERVKR